MVGNTKRTTAIAQKNLALRQELWPEAAEERLWHRKRKTGFTTMPRTMPYILQVIDDLSTTGKPLKFSYLVLWSHVFDESFIKIQNPKEMAFEAGFTGQRGEATWRDRMKELCDLGFIDAKPGPSGPYHYVLLWNPHEVIKSLKKENRPIRQDLYYGLIQRATEVGATDMYS